MGFFQTFRQTDMACFIDTAANVVIYAAPGVSVTVAEALTRAAKRIGPDNIVIILDASAHTARMGFGRFETIEQLTETGVEIRVEPGLRQGLLIVDGKGKVFNLPAELLEPDAGVNDSAPNAIELTAAQVVVLRSELPNPKSPSEAQQSLKVSIGESRLEKSDIEHIKKELEVSPPQPFDLSRQVRVYSALVRFVELEMKGWKLESKRIELPSSLPVLATRDLDLRHRIKSSLNLLDTLQDTKLKKLRAEVEAIRKAYCIPIGHLGSVVLIRAQKELIAKIDDLRERMKKTQGELVSEIESCLKQALESLTPELAKAILAEPTDSFMGRYAPTEQGAEEHVREELLKVFPSAQKIVKDMSLRLTFKDVTYEVLQDKEFKKRVLSSFSRSALPDSLHEEYDAVRRSLEN